MKSLLIFFLAVTLAVALEKAFDITERLINGNPAAVGQFPHQVHLTVLNAEGGGRLCEGALISSTWVLTTAFCVNGLSFAEVHLGGIDWEKPDVSFIVKSSNFIQHEKYDDETHSNDIALIRIPPVNYTNNIQKVYLPIRAPPYPKYDDEEVVVSGWGYIDNNQTLADTLQYTKMNVISNKLCSQAYDGIIESNICAFSFKGGNICHDFGAPLLLNDCNILIGLSIFRTEICENCFPATFTRVSSYLDWIAEKTGIE